MVIKSGTNSVQRQRLLLLARQRHGGDAVGHQPGRRQARPTSPARSSAARSAGRSRRTSCSSSATTRAGGRRSPPADRSSRSSRMRGGSGDLSSLLARATPIVVRDPTDRSAVPEQPDSRRAGSARSLVTCWPTRRSTRAPTSRVGWPTSARTTAARSASSQKANQLDAKVDWNASTNDKVYVRYSKQTHQATTEKPPRSRCRSPRWSENPFWSIGANWNRIIGATHRQRPAGRLQRQHRSTARRSTCTASAR